MVQPDSITLPSPPPHTCSGLEQRSSQPGGPSPNIKLTSGSTHDWEYIYICT
jgi:hypothetical protein